MERAHSQSSQDPEDLLGFDESDPAFEELLDLDELDPSVPGYFGFGSPYSSTAGTFAEQDLKGLQEVDDPDVIEAFGSEPTTTSSAAAYDDHLGLLEVDDPEVIACFSEPIRPPSPIQPPTPAQRLATLEAEINNNKFYSLLKGSPDFSGRGIVQRAWQIALIDRFAVTGPDSLIRLAELLVPLADYLRIVVEYFLLEQDAQPEDLLMLKIGQSHVGRSKLSKNYLKTPLFAKTPHTDPNNFNFDQFFESIYRQAQSNALVEFSYWRPLTIQLWLGRMKGM